mgnify:CR=1 FL=1
MKVYLKKNITAYSGKDGEEDVVYQAHNNGNICIASNYTAPRETAQHLVFAQNAQTVKSLWSSVSAGFKNDLKSYALIYSTNNQDKTNVSGYAIFCKLLYSHAKALGSQVSDLEYDTLKISAAKSVNSAISAGYLPGFGLSLSLSVNM